MAPDAGVVLTLPAQRAVRGKVVDAASGEPIAKFAVAGRSFESEKGEFEIEVAEKEKTLEVAAAGHLKRDMPLDPANNDPILVPLSRGRLARGHIVDDHGEPIDDVAVTFSGVTTKSAADGSYEVSGLPFDEETGLAYVKSPFRMAVRKVKPGDDDVVLDVAMERGLVVTGRVVNASGAGVAGATVSVESAAYGAINESQATDESGAFRFDGLLPARYDFTVDVGSLNERGAMHDVDVAKTQELTIRLERKAVATIAGHVSGIDVMTDQVTVHVSALDGDTRDGGVDPAGNFRITNAPAGVVEVSAGVVSRNVAWLTKKVTVDAPPNSESRVDLVFTPQVTLNGRVTRGETPLPGITVMLIGDASTRVMTGRDGSYSLTLDPGEYDVTLLESDRKQLPFAQHVSVRESSQLDLHVDASNIVATVVDADSGQPIAGATVSASRRGETHPIATTTTGADGTASFEVARDALTIIASKAGHANASEGITPSDNASITLRLRPSPGAVVRIVDARDGRTLSGYVIARDPSGRVVASSDEAGVDGTAVLPLAPGKYQISASAGGYGSHTIDAEVPSSEIRVGLPRGGNLLLKTTTGIRGTARLIQPDGQPYVRCWCNGVAAIEITGPVTLVDHVAPGAYKLELKGRQIPVTVIEGETVTVPID
jgi:hypothetical protein